MQISGKTFVVTGGRSGLGEATAAMLEREGAAVVVADLPETDVTDEAAWDALAADGVAGLVHAAGIRSRAAIADTTVAAFREVLDVNVVGTFLALRWAARAAASLDQQPQASHPKSRKSSSSIRARARAPHAGHAAPPCVVSAALTGRRSAAVRAPPSRRTS